ncbi:outer membrane protein TolC [Chitinophaga terrae (ex Kim and Jung 2007)]|uniref:TolC family protein n=1 Tax=Chitinophaga terrae (ex Kim and Jung 2007) TaxID=408074 RepID=UPI0027860349|nr:TolC family protein [Chitinophaga terrae (ex Kim and Jung 2007)]MDQ0106474.1 outer membrane protein TolC [Chitinophaga terrae (ex Kim and Jung 2007)]
MIKHIIAGKLCALLCLLCYTSSSAQSAADSFSLHRAIALTMEHYPAIRAKASQVKAGEANLTDVKHNWYPALRLHEQVDVGTDNSIYGSYFTMGMIPSTSGGIRAANNSSLMSGNIAMAAMQWEIYNFGGYGSQQTEASKALQVSRSDLHNLANQLTVSVITQYLELLKYHALQQIAEDNVRRNASVVRAVTAIVLHGLKPGVDSAVAAAELSKARLNLLDIHNKYEQVRVQLSVLTGLDTSNIRPDTVNTDRLIALLQHQPGDSVQQQHPMLEYYNAIYEQQTAKEAVIRKSTLPKVNLMAAGWMRGSSGSFNDVYDKNLWSGLGYSRYNYLLGLGITYNLADLKRTREKVAVQKYQSETAARQMETIKTNLNGMLQQSLTDLKISSEKLQELPLQLNAAKAAARQKMALYRGGLTNIIDVTTALFVLNRAETDLVMTRDAAWKALFSAAYASNSIEQLLPELN